MLFWIVRKLQTRFQQRAVDKSPGHSHLLVAAWVLGLGLASFSVMLLFFRTFTRYDINVFFGEHI